jgi:hypothetical protein
MIEGKEFDKVNEEYDNNHVQEFIICDLLNKLKPNKFTLHGYFFEMNTGDQHEKWDLNFIHIAKDRTKTRLAKIEYEFGDKQEDVWGSTFNRNIWVRGLSLLCRKKYDENFDLFLKVSPEYSSYFAVDTRNNYVTNYFEHTKDKVNHSLPYVTDNLCYSIGWEYVDKHNFMINHETKKVIRNSNICVKENGDYMSFFMFLFVKYILQIPHDKTI